ncbi:MAG: pyridoxal phosphate-dependent aminotransferase [Gracilibacteraceae bacterium]|jgi:aspartate/methionine/tyrosine aminotransferase|nr:pyridoxal phosphate-dependent aminotransferase [Gracilibacteraceae bacterium]
MKECGELLAGRMSRLGSETAFEMLAAARALEAEGREIIHLEIGEPDFPTPANIIAAGIRGLEAGLTKYTPSAGTVEARRAIAAAVGRTCGYAVDPDQVVMTAGGKPIMFYTILAATDSGDEVIYPNPGFPIYESMIRFAGGVPVPLPLREADRFRLDVSVLKRLVTPRTKLVIINSPQNPTGGVVTRDDLREAAEFLRERDLLVLSDEIYENILYEGEHASISSFPGMREKTIILNGFSKTYAMTGWRAGYGVMPLPLAAHINKLVVNSTSCLAGYTQAACIEALTGPQEGVRERTAEFRARRDVIVAGLNAIPGITCAEPDGAFYVFPNISRYGRPSRAMADYLLQEAGVATLGGNAFGIYGEGYLRISYAASLENIRKAIALIEAALGRLEHQ